MADGRTRASPASPPTCFRGSRCRSLVGTCAAVATAKPLSSLLLGETYARSLGVTVTSLRHAVLAAVVLLVAPVVAFCGPVSFVGLIAPHFARALAGTARILPLLPLAALGGALLALAGDAIIHAPWEQHFLHLNAILAIVGAPAVDAHSDLLTGREAVALMLDLRSLAVGYRSSRGVVLSGIDLSAAPGDFICILGRNGSGKSTLMRTIAGLQTSLDGTLHLLDGEDIASMRPATRARRIAVSC